MSQQDFHDFLDFALSGSETDPAKKSHPIIAGILSGFDRELTGEAKGMAVMKKLTDAARICGFNVSFDDVKTYMKEMKTKYEGDPTFAHSMDIFCRTTCHLASATGSKTK